MFYKPAFSGQMNLWDRKSFPSHLALLTIEPGLNGLNYTYTPHVIKPGAGLAAGAAALGSSGPEFEPRWLLK